MVEKASLQRLKFCNFKLDSLLEITQAINENLSTSHLLKKYETLLRDKLNIGKVLIFDYNKQWEIMLESGYNPRNRPEIDVDKELLTYTEITTTSSTGKPNLLFFDVIIPVYHNKRPLAFILIGDIEEKEGISPTIKHLHFIQTLTNVIIVAIENKRLFKDNLQQERMKKEMEMASKMQEMLIPGPEASPKNEHFIIETFYFPHFEVGGDYFDFDKLSDNEYFFCIADVSGKGMSAALLMSNFQANLKALFTSAISLTELIKKLNYRVLKNANGEKFITLFVAKYNTKTQILTYVNAGHNAPIFYSSETGEMQYLSEGCVGVGMIDEIVKVEEKSIIINGHSKLLCYTDGLVELEYENQIQCGQKMVETSVSSNNNMKTTIANLIESLNISKRNSYIFDDITMLGVEFFPK